MKHEPRRSQHSKAVLDAKMMRAKRRELNAFIDKARSDYLDKTFAETQKGGKISDSRHFLLDRCNLDLATAMRLMEPALMAAHDQRWGNPHTILPDDDEDKGGGENGRDDNDNGGEASAGPAPESTKPPKKSEKQGELFHFNGHSFDSEFFYPEEGNDGELTGDNCLIKATVALGDQYVGNCRIKLKNAAKIATAAAQTMEDIKVALSRIDGDKTKSFLDITDERYKKK